MARVKTEGLKVVADELKEKAERDYNAAIKGLEDAAVEVAKLIKESAEGHGLRDTGRLIESIEPGPVRKGSDSAEIDIWPQGTRETRRGRKTNAVVGFVQHYGRRYKLAPKNIHRYSAFDLTREGEATYRRGTFFFDTAYVKARQEGIVVKCMKKKLDESK